MIFSSMSSVYALTTLYEKESEERISSGVVLKNYKRLRFKLIKLDEDEYKSVMRDYKQSLITELENITHVECVRKSIQNLESCAKKDI